MGINVDGKYVHIEQFFARKEKQLQENKKIEIKLPYDRTSNLILSVSFTRINKDFH